MPAKGSLTTNSAAAVAALDATPWQSGAEVAAAIGVTRLAADQILIRLGRRGLVQRSAPKGQAWRRLRWAATPAGVAAFDKWTAETEWKATR